VGTLKVPLLFAMRESAAHGVVVPMPVNPPFDTSKEVEVPVEEEPMTNDGPAMPLGLRERYPHGVEVPSPNLLLVSSQKKLAAVADWLKSPDPVELANTMPPL
jgi:hypothetical protein